MECVAVPSVLDEIDAAVENRLPPLNETEEDMADATKINNLSNRLTALEKNTVTDSQFDALSARFAGVEKSLEAISNSINRPSGSNRVARFLRDWGLLGACAAGVLALIGIAITLGGLWASAHSAATTRAVEDATFKADTSNHLALIDARLASMQLSSLTAQPYSEHTAQQIVSIIDVALQKKQKIDPSVVSEAGRRLVKESETDASAWRAALTVATYKSVFNPDPASPFGPPNQYFEFTVYDSFAGGWKGRLAWVGESNVPNIPQFRMLDGPDLNQGNPRGPSLLVAKEGSITLDGMFLKQVVFSNVKVIYHGGALHLEGVSFVNCTFEWDRSKNSILLANTVLSPGGDVSIVTG